MRIYRHYDRMNYKKTLAAYERRPIMKKGLDSLFKFVIYTCIIVGIGLVSWSGWQYFDGKKHEEKATTEAFELVEKAKANPIEKKDFVPNFGDAAGMLVIDKIEANLPIVEGTSEDDLKKGIGHYEGTSYPLDDDQIMLSGHRDTVFTRIGELDIGDILTVQMPYGEFEYEIVNTKIVDADDRSIIVPHDEEVLTVSTCYPFGYIGHAPDRYIIDAKPIYDKSEFDHIIEY